jgi:uncharacterized protein YbjT (DUF2867 family)
MNPTPPPAPSNGVAILMAEIERIAQELRAVNKRPLPATEDQVKALVKLAERDRPLTLNVNSEAVAKQLVGQVDKQAQVFQTTGYELIKYLDDRQKTMSAALDKGVAAVQAAEAKLQASAQQIPCSVPLNVFDNWRSTLSFTLGPVVLVLLGMLFTGHFSRVPKEELARVQAELALARGAVQRFQECRAELAKDRPELAYQYFPYTNDPKPAPAKKRR